MESYVNICANTHATHLGPVADITVDAFLLALRRLPNSFQSIRTIFSNDTFTAVRKQQINSSR